MNLKTTHPREAVCDPIPGIYDYCDRWCERCPFTARCMNYAMEQEHGRDAGARGVEDDALWDEMSSVFDVTLDLLRESADEYGVGLNVPDDEAEEESPGKRPAAYPPVVTAAFAYIEMADQWLEEAQTLLEEKLNEREVVANLELPGDALDVDLAVLTEALDVVAWYHAMIYPKMMRALGQRAAEPVSERDVVQKDSNGSAKVALLCIDRSIEAWKTLLDHCPMDGDRILDMLLHLDRLRRSIEDDFPNARAFQRIGFDYLPDEAAESDGSIPAHVRGPGRSG